MIPVSIRALNIFALAATFLLATLHGSVSTAAFAKDKSANTSLSDATPHGSIYDATFGNRKPAEQKKDSDNEKNKDKDKKDSKEKKDEVRADAPCISWVKFGVPLRAVLLCVHGLGLNSQSFDKFGTDMSKLGITTYAIDVRGFGSWMEAKGHQKVDFTDCIQDVKKTLDWLHKANGNKPVFLMGESMGGAIALHVAAEYPDSIDGVISVCSSGDRFKQKRTDLKVFLHALMGPRRKFDIGKSIVNQAAGQDGELKNEWEGDELDRMSLSPIELLQFQHFMNENHDEAQKITKLPVLMVQGTNDKLVKPEGTEELYDELKTPDKELMLVQNAKHIIFEDDQFSETSLSDVAKWIFKHCPAPQYQAEAFEQAMEKASAALENGQVYEANKNLQQALQINPNGPRANLLMGIVQTRLKHYPKARLYLAKASRAGQGTHISDNANRIMLMLPRAMVIPRKKGQQLRRTVVPAGTPPTVLIFGADWCKPCQEMKTVVEQARQRYGNRVTFTEVDVDSPENSDLVEQYSIGPVPTTIFLAPNGQVMATQVGFAGLDGMLKGLQQILPVR